MPTPSPTALTVTRVPEGSEVARCEEKFHATPSMVREVPVAPETQFQPPLVVIRGTCAIPGVFPTLLTLTLALPTLFIERSDPRTERGDTEHDKVVDVADASDVGP